MATTSTWKVMVQFSANNLTGGAFSSLIASVSKAHLSTDNLQKAIAGLQVAGGVALVDFGRKAVDVFSNAASAAGAFQQQIVLMRQAMGDLSDAQKNMGMGALAQQRTDLMIGKNSVLFGQSDLTKIQMALLQAGTSAQDITKQGRGGGSLGQMLTYVAELEQQRGYSTSPQNTATNLSKFLTAYGVKGDDAATVLNTFQKSQSVTGGFTSGTMQLVEQYFGQTARNFGLKADDVVTLAGLLTRAGFHGSTIGTGLMNMFTYGTNPALGATSTEISGRFQAAVRLGAIGGIDVNAAKRESERYQAMLKADHIPSDLAALSKHQQDVYATQMLLRNANTGLLESYRSGGIIGLNDYFNKMRQSEITAAGGNVRRGEDMFNRDMTQFLGMRGSREGLVFGQDFVKQYLKTVLGQSDADILIAQLRGTMQGKEQQIRSRSQSILVSAGGVDPVTGKPIPGGPLDYALKILDALNMFLGKVQAWATANPAAIAHLTTGLGILGVGAMVGGGLLAATGAGRLVGALIGPGGRAAVGGLAKSSLGMFAHGFGNPFAAFDAEWMFGNAFRDPATGRFVKNAGMFGGRLDFNATRKASQYGARASRDIIGPIADIFKVMLEPVRLAVPWLLKVGTFFLKIGDFVGWIFLAIDAFKFFKEHPKDIAHWIAQVVIFFKEVLIPGIKTSFSMFLGWLVGELKTLLEMLNPMNWGKIPGYIHKVMNDAAYEESVRDKILKGRAAGSKSGGSGNTVIINHTNNQNIHGSDPKKTAEHSLKLQKVALAGAIRKSTGGLGIPGLPHAITGVV